MFNDIKRLFRHSLIYGSGQAIVRLANLFILPVILRYLRPEEYGVLEIFVIIIGIATTVFGFSLKSAIVRYYCRSEAADRKKLVSTAFWGLCMISVPILLVLSLFSKQFSNIFWGSKIYAVFFTVTFIAVIFRILYEIPFTVLRVQEKSLKYIIFAVINLLSLLGLNLYFVVVLKLSSLGMLLGNMAGSILVFLLFSKIILAHLTFSFSWVEFSKLLRFGLPVVSLVLTLMVINVSDRFFLKSLTTLEELGQYALAYKFGILVYSFLVFPFKLAWNPFAMSVETRDQTRDIYSRVLTYFLFAALFLWLGISLFAQDVIRLIAPLSYWGAYKTIPVIALAYVFLGVAYNVGIGIFLKEKTKNYLYIAGGTAGLNIILNSFLIPIWGVVGAAIATLCSYAAMAILMFIVSRKLYQIKYEWLRLFKLCLICSILYLVLLFANFNSLGVRIAVFMIYPIVFYFFVLVEQEKKNVVKLLQRFVFSKNNELENL